VLTIKPYLRSTGQSSPRPESSSVFGALFPTVATRASKVYLSLCFVSVDSLFFFHCYNFSFNNYKMRSFYLTINSHNTLHLLFLEVPQDIISKITVKIYIKQNTVKTFN